MYEFVQLPPDKERSRVSDSYSLIMASMLGFLPNHSLYSRTLWAPSVSINHFVASPSHTSTVSYLSANNTHQLKLKHFPQPQASSSEGGLILFSFFISCLYFLLGGYFGRWVCVKLQWLSFQPFNNVKFCIFLIVCKFEPFEVEYIVL